MVDALMINAEEIPMVKKILGQVGVETEASKALCALIKSIAVQTCTFCKGAGHNAKRCGFKKTIDMAVVNAPILKKRWG